MSDQLFQNLPDRSSPVFSVGRTVAAVDGQSEIRLSVCQPALPWQPVVVGSIHRTDGCRWTQAASGTAGRANVGSVG